jgi:hypothetical protein
MSNVLLQQCSLHTNVGCLGTLLLLLRRHLHCCRCWLCRQAWALQLLLLLQVCHYGEKCSGLWVHSLQG